MDVSAFRANLHAWLSHPIAGIVIAGSTGEAPFLSRDELLALLDAALPLTEGRRLIAGTGAEATRDAIALSRAAGERGVDAVLVRSPSYYQPAMSPAVLRDHFHAVADASPVPVILYHIPKFVPVRLDPELAGRLMEHPNIVGIKDSSGDLANLAALVEACGSHGSVLVGSGALLYAALEAGARGGILGVGLLATRSATRLYDAWGEGDSARAGALQERIGPLHKAVVAGLGVPGVKAALDALGLAGGAPRPPLQPLAGDRREAVEAALEAAGLGASSGAEA